MAGKTIKLSKYRWKKTALPESVASAGDACFFSLEEIEPVDDDPNAEVGATINGSVEDIFPSGIDLDSFIHIDEFDESKSIAPKSNNQKESTHSTKKLKRISAKDTLGHPFVVEKTTAPNLNDHDTFHITDAPVSDEPIVDHYKVPSDSKWLEFGLNLQLVQTLHKLGFSCPTDIQAKSLENTLVRHKDIIGAAETGSGKTLAFGLPILHHLAIQLQKNPNTACIGLIITPTRELAIQVSDHLKRAGAAITHKITPIVGGMSLQKQRRLIATKPHIIVGTPGRLWELIQEDPELLDMLKHTTYLVIDEADRMLEAGHFKDLDSILGCISVCNTDNASQIKRRTMVFSATMLEDDAIKQKATLNFKKHNNKIKSSLFNKLLQKIDFHDKSPVYINLSTEGVTAKGLLESKINCLKTEKDTMLYYVLCRYTAKTIVFVNSIDAIRRLVPILSYLGVQVFGLHAEMQQRQRLKNLDRFVETPNGVLIASDVASRGLDIPKVDHVIHYQLPRAADIYVHRSGRTARANAEGVSVALVCPEELVTYKKICHALSKENGLPDFPVDMSTFSKIKQRLEIAKQIDAFQHKEKKVRNEQEWFRKAAEEADILISDDEDQAQGNKRHRSNGVDDLDNDTHVERGAVLNAKERQKLKNLKSQLKELLEQPIMPRGISSLYLTSNSMQDLPLRLMSSGKGSIMPAFNTNKATDDLRGKVKAHAEMNARTAKQMESEDLVKNTSGTDKLTNKSRLNRQNKRKRKNN
ncbi:ATP-dependent RNA helicase [Batrachochytrium dendrobatidis]|nr:ATP-dependent RNA helicase [Batrachochytrium dendrobatidis]